ncbi:MAG: peptidoglycan editing factor PgeF [Acidobacteria bacterium]|nr:peptidoglycan editing factor PgeF [Acidobacteriota bacterium]
MYQCAALAAIPWLRHGFGTRLSHGWLDGHPAATLKQIHSAAVVEVEGPGPAGEGDALITSARGVWLAVRTADCVPVILADLRTRAVAIVHSGWRGTAAEVTASAVEAMAARFGTEPEDLAVAIGPAIGRCCYEVSREVAGQFTRWLGEPGQGVKAHLDLEEAIVRQLAGLGVVSSRITRARACTHCDGVRFESYRRDGDRSGRMVSAVMVV